MAVWSGGDGVEGLVKIAQVRKCYNAIVLPAGLADQLITVLYQGDSLPSQVQPNPPLLSGALRTPLHHAAIGAVYLSPVSARMFIDVTLVLYA